ncbi:substrate-binding domain-containing protein [Coraliomargarita parva]|uniref:substrate-binding domain-containing protein n=1 Tax=Coraliomargarita parva TaxID=3014050 RepID=UPI0022B53C17|nr:substrate-binding domain-containing protein [Coraliomargarita parva]
MEKAKHPLVLARESRGWTQMDLAKRARVPRSSVSAIESGRLTPSVSTALHLARVLELSVEALFDEAAAASAAANAMWSWAPDSEMCRFIGAEVKGRRIFYPINGQAHAAHLHDGIWKSGEELPASLPGMELTLVMASCDPASALMEAAYARESGYRLVSFAYNGMHSLELLKDGLVHVAGLHRSNREHPARNADTVRTVLGEGYCLLRGAHWDQGLAFAPGHGLSSVASVLDKAQIWAMRESGSVARDWLDVICAEMGQAPSGREVHSHRAVADSIRMGWADAGVCVKLSAKELELSFLSLQEEALDFIFHESMLEDPRIQALIRLLQSKSYRRVLSELPGYDSRETGGLNFN